MNRFLRVLLAAMLTLSPLPAAFAVDAPLAPTSVKVAAEAHYAADGSLASLTFVEPSKQPAGFLAMVEKQVKKRNLATILPKPVVGTFDTGMIVTIVVTPRAGGADARISDIALLPRILRRAMAAYPNDLGDSPDWQGKLTGQCVIGIDGRCKNVLIASEDPGMPPSGHRFVTDSLAKWKFQPQRIDGKPIEFTLNVPFVLHTQEASPPEYFGGPRL